MSERTSSAVRSGRRRSVTRDALRCLARLSALNQDDADLATADKEEIYRDGKLALYRYVPVAEASVEICQNPRPKVATVSRWLAGEMHMSTTCTSGRLPAPKRWKVCPPSMER